MCLAKVKNCPRIIAKELLKSRRNDSAAQRFNRILAPMEILRQITLIKLRPIVVVLMLFTGICGQSQPPNTGFPDKVTADEFAGRDKFGAVYAIRNNNLLKITDGKTVEFRSVASGRISKADISNPLLIVLLYTDFNLIILLDNQLNEVRRIDFNAWPTPIVVQAAGLAGQNQLWVYDSLSQRIHLYDLSRNRIRPISVPLSAPPVYYQTDYNHFQWLTEKRERFACDLFGKISNLGTLPAYDQAQLLPDGAALWSVDGVLFYQKTPSDEAKPVSGFENSFKKFYYDTQFLTIFTHLGITNFKITLP